MRLIFILSVFLVFSCNKKSEPKIEKQNWSYLQIVTQFQKITIDKNSDSCDVENIIWNKGIYKIPPTYKVEDTINTKIYLTQNEKDSLKEWILSSIIEPKFTEVNASDYVGNVELKFINGNTILSCKYRSVGEWNEVSKNTEKIYNLVSSKTKLSKQ